MNISAIEIPRELHICVLIRPFILSWSSIFPPNEPYIQDKPWTNCFPTKPQLLKHHILHQKFYSSKTHFLRATTIKYLTESYLGNDRTTSPKHLYIIHCSWRGTLLVLPIVWAQFIRNKYSPIFNFIQYKTILFWGFWMAQFWRWLMGGLNWKKLKVRGLNWIKMKLVNWIEF